MNNIINKMVLICIDFFYNPSIKKILSSLFPLCVVIIILYWIIIKLRLVRRNIKNHNIKVLSYVYIGPKEKVVIVDYQKLKLILGVTPYSINYLYKLPLSSNENKELLKTKNNIK